VTIRPLITDKALEKVEEHLKDAMEKAALDKRGETGVLSNTDVHYYGPVLLCAFAVIAYDNKEKCWYETALTFVFCRLFMPLL